MQPVRQHILLKFVIAIFMILLKLVGVIAFFDILLNFVIAVVMILLRFLCYLDAI